MAGEDPPPYAFSVEERARLVAYRAAIRAGFFTDRDPADDPTQPPARQIPDETPPAGGDPAFGF